MIPRIDLSQWTEDTVPKREVEKMTEALSEAFAMLLREKKVNIDLLSLFLM